MNFPKKLILVPGVLLLVTACGITINTPNLTAPESTSTPTPTAAPTTSPTATGSLTPLPMITTVPPNTTASWKTYSESAFDISYPSNFVVEKGAGLAGAMLDTSHVRLAFPETAFASQNTNFDEAYVVVSSSTNTKECTSFTGISSTIAQTKNINGVTFSMQPLTDAGAGNLYDSEIYRVVHNQTCYEVTLTLHTANVNNFDPSMGVKEFARSEAFDTLNQILNTFSFSK